jgi:hypothetical protein
VKTGEDGVFRRHAMRRAGIDVADADSVAALPYIDDRRLQTKAHVVAGTIKRAIVEAGEHDVIHCVPGPGAENERAHQKARQRSIAVGEMINVRLAHSG